MLTAETIGPTDALNILRAAICIVLLSYSCITDWRTRLASDYLWYGIGVGGIAIGLYDLYVRSTYLGGFDYRMAILWGLSFSLIYVIMFFIKFMFSRMSLMGMGGADRKALIAIAIMFPYYPYITLAGAALPLSDVTRTMVFALAVFGNALALNLVVPLGLCVYNMARVPASELLSSPANAFLGYKMKVKDIKDKHVSPMYRYDEENGAIRKKRVFGGSRISDEDYDNMLKWSGDKKIDDTIWVTPRLPFLIPITLGFIVAIVYGDILTQIISFVLYR